MTTRPMPTVRASGCPRHAARADLPQERGGEEERPQLPHGQQAQVQGQPGRQEHGEPAQRVEDLEHAQGRRDRTGEERPQELDEEDRDHVEQRVLDLLQPARSRRRGRTSTGCAGACRRRRRPRRGRTRGTRADRAGGGRAGGGRGRPRRTGPRRRARAAPRTARRASARRRDPGGTRLRRARERSGWWRPTSTRAARAPDARPARWRRWARSRSRDGRSRCAARGRQRAHAAQALAAREHLVGAVHLADGQAEAQPRAFRGRGSEALGPDLHGQAVPGVGLARPAAAAPAHRHAARVVHDESS